MGAYNEPVGKLHEECVSFCLWNFLSTNHLRNLTIETNSVSKLSEMTALGLGLEADYFSNAGRYGFVNLSSPLFLTLSKLTCLK